MVYPHQQGSGVESCDWLSKGSDHFDLWNFLLTHLGFCCGRLVDTNERSSVQNIIKDFPAFGWGKMSERNSRSEIKVVCRLLVKISIKMVKQ